MQKPFCVLLGRVAVSTVQRSHACCSGSRDVQEKATAWHCFEVAYATPEFNSLSENANGIVAVILPAQVPCNISSEYPQLWPRMLELLRSLVEAATPFMEHQASAAHFEFLGLDIIADDTGGVWLIEGD